MATLGQPIATSSDAVAFEGGYDAANNRVAVKQLDSSTVANGTTFGPQLVVSSGAAGYIAAAGTPPTTTTANTDTAWTFSKQVNHVLLQNNTSANVQFDLDQAATAGSPVIAPGATYFLDLKVTTIHLLTAASQNINGTSAGNIVIRGWL